MGAGKKNDGGENWTKEEEWTTWAVLPPAEHPPPLTRAQVSVSAHTRLTAIYRQDTDKILSRTVV